MTQQFELKVITESGSTKIVTWTGTSGEDAARRYVDSNRTDSVIAWRYPTAIIVHGFRPGMIIG